MGEPLLVKMEGIEKSYSGVKVLKGVNFELKPGEVHALIGENGAGKSTMIKVLMGIIPRDAGTVYIRGEKKEFHSSQDAAANGIATVFQELSLIPTLSVADNIFLMKEKRKGIFLDKKTTLEQADELLKSFHLDIDPAARVSEISTAQRQLTEICKAAAGNPDVLIFDEPTSSLTEREIASLFEMIETLKKKGMGIVYISHRMEEIFQITDRITVLRDGTYIGTRNTKDTDLDEIIKMMVGRELELYQEGEKRDKTREKVVLELRHVGSKTGFHDINLKLHRGEILGIAGLVGSGRSELMNLVYGIDRITEGEMYLHGKKVEIRRPKDAIRNGICMIPENRHLQGLVLMHSIETNIATANMDKFTRAGCLVDFDKLSEMAAESMKKFDIRAESPQKLTGRLSGGNQQKVVIAKWLCRNPQIIIVDEPTNGVDIGAKTGIHKILKDLSEQGVSIILISSEMPELLNHSDRVVVMNDHRMIAEAAQISQEEIMEKILTDITEQNKK